MWHPPFRRGGAEWPWSSPQAVPSPRTRPPGSPPLLRSPCPYRQAHRAPTESWAFPRWDGEPSECEIAYGFRNPRQGRLRRRSSGWPVLCAWLGREDSNPRSRDQNPQPYRLATPQRASRRGRGHYTDPRRGSIRTRRGRPVSVIRPRHGTLGCRRHQRRILGQHAGRVVGGRRGPVRHALGDLGVAQLDVEFTLVHVEDDDVALA